MLASNAVFAVLPILALGMAHPAYAQDVRDIAPDVASPPAALADLKGIVGDWKAEDAAMAFSAPAAGEIVGHLFIYSDKGPRIREIWLIQADGPSLVLRQKHFLANMTALEDKNNWGERRLVAVDPHHVYFNNITLATQGSGLDMSVRVPGQNNAQPNIVTYSFQRVK